MQKDTDNKQMIPEADELQNNGADVQKTYPLSDLWQSGMTLAEFKILDIYLSRLDSRNPNNRRIEITKDELEAAFGVSRINNKELDSKLRHLVNQAVRISDGKGRGGYAWVSLFEEARIDIDDSGVQTVSLECTAQAMSYLFSIENNGYYRYKLNSVTCLKSRYSYIMLNYIEKNRFRVRWEESLEELKSVLGCDDNITYSEFKNFNRFVFKKAYEEIVEKTETRFEYTPIRAGGKVATIRFTMKPPSAKISLSSESDDSEENEDGEDAE